MSLINDLLRDLDARHAPHPGNALAAGEPFCAAAETMPAARGSRGLLLGGLLVAVGLAGGWFYLSGERHTATPQAEPRGAPAQDVPLAAAGVPVDEVSIPPAPVVKTPAPGGLADPAAVRLPTEPAAAGHEIAEAEPREREKTTRPRHQAAAPVSSPAVASPARQEPPRPAPLIRTPHVPSVAKLDRQSVERAREALRVGRPDRAVSLLQVRLRENPRAQASRELLVSMLIQQGRIADAMPVIEDGLQLDAGNITLRLHQARVLLAQNDAAGAVAALQAVPQSETDSAKYLNMLAVSTQKLGDHVAAGALYRNLLQRFPPQAGWWVGLAVSLEASNMPGQAEAAYREGARLSGEQHGLRRFANERLTALAQVSGS